MITIKNNQEIELMKKAGRQLATIFKDIPHELRVGRSTLEIDAWIMQALQKRGMISQSMGYHGYRHVSCISVNDEIVHGVPRDNKKLRAGDLVKIDICASLNGYCADMARCFFIGDDIPEHSKKLVWVAQAALDKGIEQAKVGSRLSNISHAIQQEVERNGFGVVRIFAGHGIGKHMHEDPEILNYGKAGRGPHLQVGMALAIEPMITAGHYDTKVDTDGWTARTQDGSLAAHVEDTIIITQDGPEIITRLGDIA